MKHEDIVKKIINHIKKNRMDALESMETFHKNKVGIEHWFKVEIVRALQDTENYVISIKNKGPDLELINGELIELKGATDFNPKYYIEGLEQHITENEDCKTCIALGFDPNNSLSDLKDSIIEKAKEFTFNFNFQIFDIDRNWYIVLLERV